MTCVTHLVNENICLKQELKYVECINSLNTWTHFLLQDLYSEAKDNAECTSILREYTSDYATFLDKYKNHKYGRMIWKQREKLSKLLEIRREICG